jgi:hypothetical protein
VQLTIEWEKLKETEETLKVAEMRAIEAIQQEGDRIVEKLMSLRSGRRRDEEVEERVLEGGRRGKINQAKKTLQAPSPHVDAGADIPVPCEPEPEKPSESKRDLAEVEEKKIEHKEESKKEKEKDDRRDKKKASERKKKAPMKKSKMKVEEEEMCEDDEEEYDPVSEQMRYQEQRIREVTLDFERKHKELDARRKAIVAEKEAMEQENAAAFEASAGPMIRVESAPATVPPAVVDYTKIPAALDEALERLDTDGALRPSIINVGKVWNKSSQEGLLGAKRSAALTVAEQKLEKNTCYDLLDALTRSGGLGIGDAAVHIVVSTTHCFGRNLMDTLVKDNLNPIEKVEHTQLIVASHVFQKSPTELLKPGELARVKQNSPTLFENQ